MNSQRVFNLLKNSFSQSVTAWVFVISILIPNIDPDKIFISETLFNLVLYFSIPFVVTSIYFLVKTWKELKIFLKILLSIVIIFVFLSFASIMANYMSQEQVNISSSYRISKINFDRQNTNFGSFLHPKNISTLLRLEREHNGVLYFSPTDNNGLYRLFLPHGNYKISFKTVFGDQFKDRFWTIKDDSSASILIY